MVVICMKTLICAALLATGLHAQTFTGASLLDNAIDQAVQEGKIPGAVLLIGHKGQVIYRKAYGYRSLLPVKEPMTVDTIFDCASLTKVIATTPSVMKLFEQGKIRMNDRVTEYLPHFQNGKTGITVRNLMTHFSGLRPDLTLKPAWSGYETGIHLAEADKPEGPPGVRFVYSDINFILLGEMVHRLSGETLAQYASRNIFEPLGMKNTMFLPPASLRRRIAPTEELPGSTAPLRGVVQDPTARYMGGIAGHAGLFSTVDDLGRFAQMMLNDGQFDGHRIFSPLTVDLFTSPQSPADQPVLRGLGWDIDSPFSGERGELFPIGSYGHTGYTGTSLWIDPASQTYIILLTNSVHPHIRPAITSLRARVATITAAALGIKSPGIKLAGYNETFSGPGFRREVARNAEVKTGLDVLEEQHFQPLQGLRVGLITNHTGLDRAGRRNVDAMKAAGIRVAVLFSPEHGFAGREDHPNIANATDAATGIPILSLYGKTLRPTPDMLRGLEALVFDIQDVGARFYTYTATMAYAMEEAARQHIPFFVLDRPDPITGVHVEGPMLDADKLSFVGYYPMPLRHGMTIGELARMFNGEKRLGADLRVVAMKDWQRGDWFDSTGMHWVNPSPNIRSLNAALLYPGIGMLEYSKDYSVGRGTDAPFEQIGAEFIDGSALTAWLNGRYIPGVRVYPTRFRPESSNCAGKTIEGVRFVITNRDAFDSTRLGLELASALQTLYPGKISLDASMKLIGSRDVAAAIGKGEDPRTVEQEMQDPLKAFLGVREKYLLYK